MPTYYRTDRMILRDDPEAAARVRRLADEINAAKVQENYNPSSTGIGHEITWRIVPGVEMYSAEDVESASTCVVVYSEDESAVARFANMIKLFLRPLEKKELLAGAAAETDDNLRARMVLRAGFGAPYEFDDRFYSLIHDAMFDANVWVRAAAIHATQYSFWPQYIECLDRVAREDPDPLLRAEAGNVIRAASGEG